ncbi:hypothetical protein [Clostridium tarantellae]|uniref:Uncharacterized protein n=1 Tax=Clostridium tarantellae TaxID=39493 RepID=A0A6I1MPF1_9CLOT|nr:hypothetical protein [Clostridium tarantellae]MPQ45305.1 hypothetical protein [Clostridium tarantellae]
MGQMKKAYMSNLRGGTSSKNKIKYNGKTYEDSEDEYIEKTYTLIDCPLCGQKILEFYEHDSTPGFRDRTTAIADKMCDCDLKSYYKEHDTGIYVWC